MRQAHGTSRLDNRDAHVMVPAVSFHEVRRIHVIFPLHLSMFSLSLFVMAETSRHRESIRDLTQTDDNACKPVLGHGHYATLS